MSEEILERLYPTHIGALTRIGLLEIELENAAAELQKVHPIGEVKGIGLREVAAATKDVCAALASRPAAPAWTSEPPKVPGLYLCDRGGWLAPGRFTVKLGRAAHQPSTLWYGPIPEPPETTREEEP